MKKIILLCLILAGFASTCSAQITNPGGTGAASYTGLVATRGDLNNSNTGVGTTWIMDRSAHVARVPIAANTMQIVWGNYRVDGANVEQSAGTGTFKASVEYPAGTMTLCKFSGNTTVTITGALDATTDACGPAIPQGAKFWIRMLYTNTGSGIVFSGSVPYSATDEGDLFGSGAPTDNVTSGTIANGPGGTGSTGFHPLAIIGPTTQPSVCLLGDSRVTGFGDLVNDFTGDTGETARSIGPTYAYTKLAVFGSNLNTAVTNFTARSRIGAYCTHFIDEYGINDIGGGATAANVASNRTAMAALFPSKAMFGITIPTSTTSSDSWLTIANQTGTQNPAVVATFNGLVRAGISGEVGYFDVAAAVDPSAIGKWPVSFNLFAASGAANFATTDGIHESPNANQIIRQSGVINPSWITRR